MLSPMTAHGSPAPSPPVAVFDLDGTLTDTTHRQHFVESTPKRWEEFFASAASDRVHEEGLAAARAAVAAGYAIVYLTGRPQRIRRATEQWLRDHDCPPGELIVRRDGDRRGAVQFKLRQLTTLAATRTIALLVDDDPDVVEAVSARPDLVAHVELALWQPRVVSTPFEREQRE